MSEPMNTIKAAVFDAAMAERARLGQQFAQVATAALLELGITDQVIAAALGAVDDDDVRCLVELIDSRHLLREANTMRRDAVRAATEPPARWFEEQLAADVAREAAYAHALRLVVAHLAGRG